MLIPRACTADLKSRITVLWFHEEDVCGKPSDAILSACVRALRADVSPDARQAQTRVENWREARATGQTPPLAKLPGVKT